MNDKNYIRTSPFWFTKAPPGNGIAVDAVVVVTLANL